MIRDLLLIRTNSGGLGNRIPPLAIAAYAARRLNVPLFVRWAPDNACPGSPAEGFDLASLGYTLLDHDAYDVLARENPNCVVAMTCHLGKMCKRLDLTDDIDGISRLQLKQLRPSAMVFAKLAILEAQLPPQEKRIGVHVRRTDLGEHQRSFADQDARMTAKLDQLFEQEPRDVVFLLAADNAITASRLYLRYGPRMILTGVAYNNKKMRHTSIQDAVYDAFALSRTSRLLGTYWSTFSSMAAKMGDIPIECP